MNSNNSENKDQQSKPKETDELAGFYFSTSIKIFDPESKEILVQKRGDN